MSTTNEHSAFHPYKVINQGRSTLQLQSGAGPKVIVFAFRFIPLMMLAIGVVLFVTQKQVYFLFLFTGVAMLEALVFSFIKMPASLTIDSMGFTLELLSLKGRVEEYYLWSDVDYIRYRIVRAKNNTSLTYEALLKTGKRRSFLNFNSYYDRQQQLQEINALLNEISRKEVRQK